MDYFVRHSGVAEATAAVDQAIEQISADPSRFAAVVIYGLPGTGKRHLISAAVESAIGRGIDLEHLAQFDLRGGLNGEVEEAEVERFVGAYDRLKASGGILLAATRKHPASLDLSPHLKSRLLSGVVAGTERPSDEEVDAVVRSLAERHHLRLSDKSISLIIEHLPRDTLSFEAILAKISELCFTHGKSAKINLVRDAISGREISSRPSGRSVR